eukprot:TRINITY_DN15389_c0_g2_i4.p1 TRINITY_DN15389_c0_g2~~TRINITY_DN15389_c0_g2_i4.p1  ORF type:complete len:450 (-),score=151.16 TRINITY_DN15389_c0_g2_i4:109-1458(-)
MAAAEAASAGSGDAGGDADALKAKLQELLEETQKAERLLRDQEKEHDALMAATAAAEEARESLNSALLTPLCQAQASVSKMMKEVSTLDRAPIDEVRQLQTPPKAVVRSMAMVHGILFGREAKAAAPEWKELQKMMRREDFLGRVRGFRIQGSALVNAAVASRLRTDIEGTSSQGQKTMGQALATRKAGASNGGGSPEPTSSQKQLQLSQPSLTQALNARRGGNAAAKGGAGKAVEPLTEDVVRRASVAVAVLFQWAVAQLDLARYAEELEAKSSTKSAQSLSSHLSIAEAARAKMAAAAMLCNMKASLEKATLASPVALVESIHSSEDGPAAVESMMRQLQGAESFLAELKSRQVAMTAQMDTAKTRLKAVETEQATLEETLAELKQAPAAAPYCDCGEEMVKRECTNLADMNWGRTFWKCPKRMRGCEKRIWEDGPGRDIREARLGG